MKHMKKVTALLLALLMMLTVVLTGCVKTPDGGEEQSTQGAEQTTQGGEESTTGEETNGDKQTYTVEVKSIGGMALEGVTVMVYTDTTLEDLVNFGTTDASGKAEIEMPVKDGYVAVLSGLPAGYEVDPYYEFVGNSVSVYAVSRVIADTNIQGVSYKIGDVIRDFTVVDSDGTSHTLSEILKEKELVVLNFWYTTCSWCVEEFPYMETAYQNYNDKVEILALDPYSTDSESAIADFKTQMGLSFPMIKDYNALYLTFDETVRAMTGSTAFTFPTSVFIDRYGVICLIETGAMLSDQPFTVAFDHFTGDDYVQGLYESVESLVPEVEVNVSMPDSSEIAAAVNGEGFNCTYRAEEDEQYKDITWPFVLGEKDGYSCIKPANSGVANSFSIIYMDVELKAGEALCFDFFSSSEAYCDVLYTIVDGEDVNSISGEMGWRSCYPYVATKDGTYEIALTYVKDGDGDVGEDTVYITNLRIVDMANITEPTYIPRFAATDRSEIGFGYNNYVDVVFNEQDGYYHVGTADGPLLLADLMGYTQFSRESVYDMAYNGKLGEGYYDEIVDYFSYASNSQLAGVVTVNAELAEILQHVAETMGAEGHDKEWLQMCMYYDAYGPAGQLEDPIKGLAPFSAYKAELGDNNYFVYNRVIMPRGLIAEFIPSVSGVYRITSFADQQVDGWLFDENRNELLVYEHCERMYTDLSNVSMVFFMEAGTPYYIDIAYWDVYGMGTVPYTIEFLGESYDYFRTCAPGYFTYFETEDDNVTSEIVALGIDVALGEDGYYHEKRADGSLGSIVYADFTSLSAIFGRSLVEMADMKAFDFRYTEEDLLVMAYMERYPDNTKEKLQELWGDAFEEYAAEYRLDEVLAGQYHGSGDDMTDIAKKYAGMVLPSDEGAPELQGCVAVNAELADLLQKLMDKYTFAGVENSWTKLCFYYQHLGA